jgi:hypothetical protein
VRIRFTERFLGNVSARVPQSASKKKRCLSRDEGSDRSDLVANHLSTFRPRNGGLLTVLYGNYEDSSVHVAS